MEKEVKEFIRSKSLFKKKDNLLLAVSGGKDSVVMAHLFFNLGYSFGIAHVNYSLRGEASELDEDFTRNLAKQLGVPFFLKKLKENHLGKSGIQQKAREIRYQFFNKIALDNSFDYVLTAHHKDDVLETILFNFIRGTGADGLKGINPKRKVFRRPFLEISTKKISKYASKNQIEWREDLSNSETKYSRNFIRNEVLPLIESRWPGCRSTLINNSKIMNELVRIRDFWLENEAVSLVKYRSKTRLLDLNKIKNSLAPVTLLRYALKGYVLDSSLLKDILKKHQSGTQWFTNDKEYSLILEPGNILACEKITDKIEFNPLNFKLRSNSLNTEYGSLEVAQSSQLPDTASSNFLLLKNEFKNQEFTIRRWQPGDYFHPLGMGGRKKKLKDFLTDLKLGKNLKQKVLVLTQENKVCWVIGFRADEHFAKKSELKNNKGILLNWQPNETYPSYRIPIKDLMI